METQISNSAFAALKAASEITAQPDDMSAPELNQEYRKKEHAKPDSYTAKIVVQRSIKGVKGPVLPSNPYSKSATRFGIDQNLLTLTKIVSSPGLNTGKSSEVYKATVTAQEAMEMLDTFDKTLGHKVTTPYGDLFEMYDTHRKDLFRTYNVKTSKDKGIIWPNTEVQGVVLNELRKYSFPHLEVYLSISAKGIRATRSMTFKCLESDDMIPVITHLWPNKEFKLQESKSES